jgi:hypothetical protein
MRRNLAALVTAVLTLPLLAGCGDDEEPEGDPSSSETIEVTFSGDTVTPNGERVEVDAGEEIEFVVKADEPGSLHVHSNPEQELEYGAGTTNLTLTIDEPGVVEVEAHELEVVVVQLEVE